ncbi:hypothetical protein MMC13_006464 [Lambiella insularis]|nr:hypothetical protein [Lambiella insularis]
MDSEHEDYAVTDSLDSSDGSQSELELVIKSKTRAVTRNRRVTGQPTPLSTAEQAFHTDRYARYPLPTNIMDTLASGTFILCPFKAYPHFFEQFDHFRLFMDITVTKDDFDTKVPKRGVRLDDRSAGLALLVFSCGERHKFWPADFDTAGMLRSPRLPLGHAHKEWQNIGDKDIKGKPVECPG